jgi:hypothetical protein
MRLSKVNPGLSCATRWDGAWRVSARLWLLGVGVIAGLVAFGAATSVSSAACPNEELRSELRSGALPDCRAYELVTPPYKEGSATLYTFALSEDGGRLIASSFVGAFAGTEEANLNLKSPLTGIAYEFSRAGSGWVTRPIGPPASEYGSVGLFSVANDLESGIWELRRLSQPEGVSSLYLERIGQTTQRFIEIGPATPDRSRYNITAYLYLGNSRDLSHVLFTIHEAGFYWPFDTTEAGADSLYEYVGQERTAPSLVGVKGEGDSSELISACGTRLGSSSADERNGSMYNAVSADGSRVFFTPVGADDHACAGEQPPADELFAREEAPPAKTRTVPISCEAQFSPCADANFEGASQDGSKVFFTSTQKLLEGASEDSSPGDSAVGVGTPSFEVKGCSRTAAPGGCNLYEYDFARAGAGLANRLVLVSGGSTTPEVQGVVRISEDGSHVYFVAKGVLTGTERNGFADSAQPGADNLYVFERDARFPAGHTSFIATLSLADGETKGQRVSDWARADERQALASEEGRFLIFASVADPTHEQAIGAARQVFEYDAASGQLVRASIGQGGYNNDGRDVTSDVELAQIDNYAEADLPGLNSSLATSDGTVFFSSAAALTPQALNDQTGVAGALVYNVYEYRDGQVRLISDGRDAATIRGVAGPVLMGYDPSGSDVFFATADPLVPQDTDTQRDIYDARVNGGFPAPPPPLPCAADVCQGPLSSPPLLPVPGGSATQAGGGNLQAPAPRPAATPKKRRKAPRRKTKHAKKARVARGSRGGRDSRGNEGGASRSGRASGGR